MFLEWVKLAIFVLLASAIYKIRWSIGGRIVPMSHWLVCPCLLRSLPIDKDGLVEELAGGDEEGVTILVPRNGRAPAHDDDQSLQEGRVWSTDEYWRFTSRRLPTFGCDPEP